jgi:two-component system, OmpR family, response regulator RegX3
MTIPAQPSNSHILLVEDDPVLASLVRDELSAFGHHVHWVADGAEVEAALTAEVSLVLLDLMLPSLNGLELCKRIRLKSKVPIVMLTARSSEADRVSGLELGADDYLVKPFSLRELIARCHAQLRRAGWQMRADFVSKPVEPVREHYLDCELDRAAMLASVQGRAVALTNKEFELLCVLVDAAGRVLTREWLLVTVWGRDYEGSDHTVDNHVLKLREKLGRESHIGSAISAIRGVGYRLERA